MKTFLKGIIVGIGGIAPGLSGSVLLVILGLYEKTIHSVSTLFKNFKKNIAFLFPLIMGFGVGILIFSKIVDYLLNAFPMQTRFAFLGLVLGTVPLFFNEVKKKGFKVRFYVVILLGAALGFLLFSVNGDLFPQIKEPNLFQSALLGVAVAGSSIVPGVDSAVILSSLGLYELYVSSIANLEFSILIPAAVGLVLGAVIISLVMNFLIKKFYTFTFSLIFGLFISIIPNVLNESCKMALDLKTGISILCLILGFMLSIYMGDIKGNNKRIKRRLKK